MGAATTEQLAEQLMRRGVTDRDAAVELAAGFDETMGRCILALYRSAAQPVLTELGRELPALARRPGLSIMATEDHHVGTEEMRRRTADRVGARTEVLDGLGHWWMVQDPKRGADVLNRFWASLPD